MNYTIILDLDGTLLNENSQISSTTKDYLKNLSKSHTIILATGRPFFSTIGFYNELELKTPIITDNGGNIWYPAETGFVNFSNGLNCQIVQTLFNESKDYLRSAFFSVEDKMFAYKLYPRLLNIFNIYDTTNIAEVDFSNIHSDVAGLIYLIDSSYMQQFEATINKLNCNLELRLWGSDTKNAIYEIYNNGVSKFSAACQVISKYNLNIEKTIAFGDSYNDSELLSGVTLGVAMKNGNSHVKSISKEITEFDHTEDGLIKHLAKILG